MKPKVGLYVRDTNLNVYLILDERNINSHTGQATELQVECIDGPNMGKIRWVGRGTIERGDFPVSKELE